MKAKTKSILSPKEAIAFEGLQNSSYAHDLYVLSKQNLTDVIQIDLNSISAVEAELGLFASFDFVIASKDYHPLLVIDLKFDVTPSCLQLSQWDLKHKICAELELNYVLLDCSQLAFYQIGEMMHLLVEDYVSLAADKNTVASFEYIGCLLHREICVIEKCPEFSLIADSLINFDTAEIRENRKVETAILQYRLNRNGDSVCETVIEISQGSANYELAKGRCRSSNSAHVLGQRTSMNLAACIASREFEDIRNLIFLSNDPCSIDVVWSTPKIGTAVVHT